MSGPGKKEKYSWDDMMEAIGLLMEGDTPEESWAKTYGKNSSVAPVQLDPKSRTNSGRTETGKPGRGKKEYSGKRRAGRDEAGRGRAGSRCSGRDRTGAVATRNVQRRRDFVEGTGEKGTSPHRTAAGGRSLYLSDGNERDDGHPGKGSVFLILRIHDPYRVGIQCDCGIRRMGSRPAQIDIRITHLINDHGGLVPGVALQFEILPRRRKRYRDR